MKQAEKRFVDLVKAINTGTVARSENDLTRHLANVFEAHGLSCVVDTSPDASRKRPDILGYRETVDADLALAAEVVVEAKKPSEVSSYADLAEAMIDGLWEEKTLPYVLANISRVRLFCITSFVDSAFVKITPTLRSAFNEVAKDLENADAVAALKKQVREECELFSLSKVGTKDGTDQTKAFLAWIAENVCVEALVELKLSEITNILRIKDSHDLDAFAGRLADLVAGPNGGRDSRGVFGAVRGALPASYELLDAETQRDLHLFAMSQNPGADLGSVTQIVKEDPQRWLDDFVAASVHSLISRVFVLNAIEDIYCVRSDDPLIEEGLWVVNAPIYDGLSSSSIRTAFSERLRNLVDSDNEVIRRLAVFGAFFDWILPHLPPREFRAVFELFIVYDFADVEGDLLGRFFELYAQRVNKTKRKALGQYYTPLPIVRFMWWNTMGIVKAIGIGDEFTVLDPGMGSGTFLTIGIPYLAEEFPERFWERFVGFDISPQVMGIAESNIYMAVLAQLDRDQAADVGELRLYTTDTLDPRNGKFLKELIPLFSDERHREYLERTAEIAGSIKRQDQFRLVIGNPPYKNNSRLTLAHVAEQFPALLKSSVEAARAQERNVRDDYAWFFCAADAYVKGNGLISFITSHSYTYKASYRFFREELLKRYRIHSLVLLGTRVFQDVSPRLSFAIITCERRERDLDSGNGCEAIPIYDLSGLEEDSPAGDLGSPEDPRFILFDQVVNGDTVLPDPTQHTPKQEHDFAMLPISEDLVGRVQSGSVPVFTKRGDRFFLRKWPGVITALDCLLKGASKKDLGEKVSAFFTIALNKRGGTKRIVTEMERWANKYGASDSRIDRLVQVAESIRQRGLSYNSANLKRSVSGTISNELRWYPPSDNWHWIYYEPAIRIPRNVNPGKAVGWGSMEQWREPESHRILPKLIFTSSANPRAGFKAFVVDDEWYVKLHGGTSQQYNYTGLVDLTQTIRADGVENNLAGQGEAARAAFISAGGSAEDLLHYIAGIYNSSLAMQFLEERSGHELGIRLPVEDNVDQCLELAREARVLRDLHRLLYMKRPGTRVPAKAMASICAAEILAQLGIVQIKEKAKGGKMKSRVFFELPEKLEEILQEAIAGGQQRVDAIVEELYD